MKSYLSVLFFSITCAALAALVPETVTLTPQGDALVIAERDSGCVTVRDFAGKVLRTIEAKKRVGGFLGLGGCEVKLPVTGAIAASDGTLYYTVEDGNEGKLCREDGAAVITGNRPMSPILSADGTMLYLCNRFDATLQKYDAKTLKLLAEAKGERELHGIALGADEKLLFGVNLLPTDATEPVSDVAATVTVVDAKTFEVIGHTRLVDGSTGARGIAASRDGKYIYVVHTRARYQLPTTQLERGWMNTAALSILDGTTGAYINTVLLDDVDKGAANPWGVTTTPDGNSIVVTHAGTREVSVIDAKALHERLERVARGEKVTVVSSKPTDVPEDLTFLKGIRRRFAFRADGPRGVVATDEYVYTVCAFADALVEIPFTKRIVRSKVIPLNGDKVLDLKTDPVLRGEMLFNDGTKCFQNWQSCATCHPDGIVDGLNWDLMNDGLGSPKQTKSLYLSGVTPPTMITGIRSGMKHCNRAGFRHIQFVSVPEYDTECIDAYVIAMQAQVSPYAREKNDAAIARGKKVFEKADCARCHMPELYYTAAVDPNDHTKTPLYDVGLGTRDMIGRAMDVPTLNEVWRTAPYLYDGRAKTMREVLTVWNPEDQHGITSDLTEQELSDLEIFILSL